MPLLLPVQDVTVDAPVSVHSVLDDAGLSHCCCMRCTEDAGSAVVHGLYSHETLQRYSHSYTHHCMLQHHNQADKQVGRNSEEASAEQACLTFALVDHTAMCNSANLHCEQQKLGKRQGAYLAVVLAEQAVGFSYGLQQLQNSSMACRGLLALRSPQVWALLRSTCITPSLHQM